MGQLYLLFLFQVSILLLFKPASGTDSTTVCLYNGDNHCTSVLCAQDSNPSSDLPAGNITIQICSTQYLLEKSIVIANKTGLTVQGLPSLIVCGRRNIGIHFDGIKTLVLRDVEFQACGAVFKAPSYLSLIHNAVKFRSSVFISNSTDITIARVTVTESRGNGISMFDNNGTVVVQNCTFRRNQGNGAGNHTRPGGSGLQIVLSYCGPRSLRGRHKCVSELGRDISSSRYRVENCIFSQNSAKNSRRDDGEDKTEIIQEGFGRGGGLCVIVDKSSSFNMVEIIGCNFTENSGTWGGALYIAIHGQSQSNSIKVKRCNFINNTCVHHAGGAVDLGYQAYQGNYPQNNTMLFQHCNFTNNRALFGGGVSFFSSMSTTLPNRMLLRGCTWTGNRASIGSAIDIAPQIWNAYNHDFKTKIIFSDCNFTSNTLTDDVNTQKRYISFEKGRGTVLAVGYHILLEGTNIFKDNTGSAMYLTSSKIEFAEQSSLIFTNNTGFQGGAIYMLGFSILILNDDSEFVFTDNSALDAGGAIYQYTYDKRDFFTSKSCFIRYNGTKNITERNVTFLFQNNTVGAGRNSTELGKYGHSIYATTITPCYNSYSCQPDHFNDTFNCFANFVFEEECDYDISTSGSEITLNVDTVGKYNITWAIPGKLFELPIRTLNDLSREIAAGYFASVKCLSVNCSVQLDNAYAYMSNKLIRFYGLPGDKAILSLESTPDSKRELVFKMQVNIQECPPGFIHNETKLMCECSSQTENRFAGIRDCDNQNFSAKLIPGYYVAYDKDELNDREFGEAKYLLHGYCPRGQCSGDGSRYQTLPQNTSVSALDTIICGISRTGIFCSRCREGYAANYHDDTNKCKKIHHDCKWSWLLYIVSEIIPVTLFFTVVMVFNIKFTDGAISGVVLFVQMSDTMLIRGNGFISFPAVANFGLEAYRFMTRIYNLNFFAIDSLSFCLWKQATTLDLLAFKYITIFYACTLVVVIIVVFRYCHSKKMNSMLVKIKPGKAAASTKSTIIHGLSGFLVICYSECTRISLLLLTPAQLYASGEHGNIVKYIVPFYDGELKFFGGKHLAYALPALLILVVVGVIPPILLMAYPLCYRAFSILRIGESKFSKILCTCVPLEKFKPFFDSFQHCFKDDYRFFSGLYFLYRFTTLATFAFVSRLTTFYMLVQIQLLVILTLHALCQPYKKRWHNVLDALIFMNLSTINAITLFNYHLTLNLTDEQLQINASSTVQVILLYLPLVYLSTFSVKKLLCKIKCCKAYIVQAYRQKRVKVTRSKVSPCRDLSGTFSLNTAEYRLQDNIVF